MSRIEALRINKEEDKTKYNAMRYKVKQTYRKKKREHLEKTLKRIEEHFLKKYINFHQDQRRINENRKNIFYTSKIKNKTPYERNN